MGMESLEVEKEKDVLRDAMGKKLEGLIPIVEAGMHDLKSEVRYHTHSHKKRLLTLNRSPNSPSRR